MFQISLCMSQACKNSFWNIVTSLPGHIIESIRRSAHRIWKYNKVLQLVAGGWNQNRQVVSEPRFKTVEPMHRAASLQILDPPTEHQVLESLKVNELHPQIYMLLDQLPQSEWRRHQVTEENLPWVRSSSMKTYFLSECLHQRWLTAVGSSYTSAIDSPNPKKFLKNTEMNLKTNANRS